jgi:hypothetical protein
MKNIQTHLSHKNIPKRASMELVHNEPSTHHFKSDKKVLN